MGQEILELVQQLMAGIAEVRSNQSEIKSSIVDLGRRVDEIRAGPAGCVDHETRIRTLEDTTARADSVNKLRFVGNVAVAIGLAIAGIFVPKP